MLHLPLISLLLASATQAQTPPGIPWNITTPLNVTFGTTIVTPGVNLPKTTVATQLDLGTVDGPLNGTWIFIMIDYDVPGAYIGEPPNSRVTNLHAFLTDFTSSPTTNGKGLYALTSSSTTPESYLAPGPPAETPLHPHRYVELLVRQPDGFAVPAGLRAQLDKRVGFNLTSFSIAAGLGAPERANWFTVTG